jgi:hypothetical protein
LLEVLDADGGDRRRRQAGIGRVVRQDVAGLGEIDGDDVLAGDVDALGGGQAGMSRALP